MCATICNPLIGNPAMRNPANHYRLACVRPASPTCQYCTATVMKGLLGTGEGISRRQATRSRSPRPGTAAQQVW
eukprot:6782616-Alexandrium_andersonii.AAC.1